MGIQPILGVTCTSCPVLVQHSQLAMGRLILDDPLILTALGQESGSSHFISQGLRFPLFIMRRLDCTSLSGLCQHSAGRIARAGLKIRNVRVQILAWLCDHRQAPEPLPNSVSTSVESLYRHQTERGSIFPEATQPSGTMSGIWSQLQVEPQNCDRSSTDAQRCLENLTGSAS